MPNIEMFFANQETTGKFITDISAIDTKTVGKTKIELEIDGKRYNSTLTIKDTIPPKGEAVEQYIFKGNTIEASDLVTNIEDETPVVCIFESQPKLNQPGWQDITVILTDSGGNTAKIASRLYIIELIDEIVVEAGTITENLSEKNFVHNYAEDAGIVFDFEGDILDFSALNSSVGSFRVVLKTENYTLGETCFFGQSILTVTDTMPPKGRAVEQYIFKGSAIEASDLVTDIEDATPVTCSFASPPDLTKFGWQDVAVVLTDGGGNTASIDSKFYVFELIDEMVFEAGTVPTSFSERDFILNYIDIENLSVDLQGNVLDYSRVGSVPITLKSGKFTGQVFLKIIDTIPPKGKAAEQYIFKGNTFEAADLVTDIEDETPVICTFKSQPNINQPGWQNVVVILTDDGGNTTEIDTGFYMFDIVDEVVMEAGSVPVDFSEKTFLLNYPDTDLNYAENAGLTFDFQSGLMDFNTVADIPITLKTKKSRFTGHSVLKIVDTTPPTANVIDKMTYVNKPVEASAFVYNIKDFSPVTVRYREPPDFSTPGIYAVYIILEDAYQNKTEYKAELLVILDTEPPKISGTLNKSVVVGGSISYRAGVIVTDDYDPNPSLSVDSSKVNLNKTGTYPVTYTAIDESGNKAVATATITVRAIDMNLVNEMADDILSKITTSNMSAYSKAYAIYKWVHQKMSYSANQSAREIAQRTYECFTKGSGDCYTYMAASQVLLTRAGIKNTEVQRMGGSSAHYWNLVDTGGGWYHFDVCPTPKNGVTIDERFMFTESKAQEYTEIIGMSYYIYNKSTAPQVVED